MKTATARELIFHHFGLHLEGLARTLHHCPVGSGVATHEDGNAYQTVVAHHADFSTRAVFHYVKQGNDRSCREIDIVHFFAGFIENLTERKREELQIRQQARQLLIANTGEQIILTRFFSGSGGSHEVLFSRPWTEVAFHSESRSPKPIFETQYC